MKIKTSELTDQILGWSVAMALGYKGIQITDYGDGKEECFFRPGVELLEGKLTVGSGGRWKPQSDLNQGFPIIDQEGIATRRHSSGTWYAIKSSDLGDDEGSKWSQFTFKGGERYGKLSYQVRSRQQRFEGPTLLVAAMRCFVASKLGAEVDVPEKLLRLEPKVEDEGMSL